MVTLKILLAVVVAIPSYMIGRRLANWYFHNRRH